MILAFGDHRLDIERRELRRGADIVDLEPKAFDLLAFLVLHRDRVVTKDDLLQGVWDGRIVSESALTTRINAVRRALGDDGTAQRLVRTFTRKGVRFIGNVTELADQATPTWDKPSIAVLPFQNMSGDPEQEYFVDGVVEEIITAISRLPWLFVIARNSSFAYKGKSPDLRRVGRELGVRYVLEGSLRKAANRVRITGQLIDTTTGAHIWADRFDGALDDIFELQDEIAASVVGAIEPKLRQSEIERATRKPTESLDAYDLYLRALALSQKYTDESVREALILLERALAIDGSYAPAAAMIGWCRSWQKLQGWGPVSDAEIADALQLARRAIEAGKDEPEALCMAGNVISFLGGDHATAAGVIERGLVLNPNSALGWFASGLVLYRQNRPDRAIEAFQRAMRLSPFDPLGYRFSAGLAVAHLIAGRYQEAIEWADRSLCEVPRYESTIRNRVVACAHLGRIDEARDWLRRLLEITPRLTIARYKALYGITHPPGIIDIYVEGLRKAGLPEE